MRPILIISVATIFIFRFGMQASSLYDNSLFMHKNKGDLLYEISQKDNNKSDLRIWRVVVTSSYVQGQGGAGTTGSKQEAVFSNDDRVSAIKRLLMEGADVNARDPITGCSALDMAISLNYRPVVWLLIGDQNGNKLNSSSLKTAIKAAEECEDELFVLRLSGLRDSLGDGARNASETDHFKCEVVPGNGYDEVARTERVNKLKDKVVSCIEFKNTPVLDAMARLSQVGQQAISCLDNCLTAPPGLSTTSNTVTFSMTNATFLTVLDKLCEKSNRYWGFKGGELISLPTESVAKRGNWVRRE